NARLDSFIGQFDNRLDSAVKQFDSRLDATISHFDTRLDAAIAKSDARFETAIAKSDARLDAAIAKVDARLDTAIAKVDARFEAISAKIDVQSSEFAAFRTRTDLALGTVRWVMMTAAGAIIAGSGTALYVAKAAGSLETAVQQQQRVIDEIKQNVSEIRSKK
ncbi:MAG: hypothetical protein ACRDD1_13300, partial [Planctomycetia bacterium]